MPDTAPSSRQEYGMDKTSSIDGRHLSLVTKSVPLNDSENEIAPSASTSARSSLEQSRTAADSRRSSFPVEAVRSNGPRDVILKAFLPRVAVYASHDTEELVRLKGIYGGLCGLLRPFGETVSGKVGIRDSSGISRSWDGYGVHFVPFERRRMTDDPNQTFVPNVEESLQEGDWSRILKATPEESGAKSTLDEVVNHFIDSCGRNPMIDKEAMWQTPSYYDFFLRKVLAHRPLTPHETFSHPVACVVAISSQTPDPISTLGDLYHNSRADVGTLPYWVNNGFLRYYVLVHDEDHDDLAASTNLFAQMKRHFGLHCHMLRLRGVECTKDDAEGTPLPVSAWLDPEEDIVSIRQSQSATDDDFQQHLYASDAGVIRTFVRELVTQSIIPYMENRVTTWNDQIASRRRGVAGRLMSMSKRWTGFGSVRGRGSQGINTDKDYDPDQGAYKPESSVALMHRLADHAFMLRDWKLSVSIYDLLRSDFNDDKAWHHYAEAHQMTAISLLLSGQSSTSRGRVDTINQLLDTAAYSFITRCGSPAEASRCMILGMELYLNNAGVGAKEAPRWGKRLLELSFTSRLTQVLLAERLAIASSYENEINEGSLAKVVFRRSAFWNFLAAELWIRLGNPHLAKIRLHMAKDLYETTDGHAELSSHIGRVEYLAQLSKQVSRLNRPLTATFGSGDPDTFFEDLAPLHNSVHGQTSSHQHSRSAAHRRGVSQQIAISAISRQDDLKHQEDDGFN